MWKPIETIASENPIWVLKYDMYWSLDNLWATTKDDPKAVKFTSCHGYYTSKEDAIKVQNHFPNPSAYTIEKIYKRELL